ncbi:MAG: redox-regulated ATPase YchF [Candidatus Levybacteria bacterium]|nr:redox-regulated ATPase YchF [Candidatus Levybacteria bacterium]
MNLSVGIVGLPNVGKSTLFNALLKRQVAHAANYPFATIEPNVGVVAVPDDRLLKLQEIVRKEIKILGYKDIKKEGQENSPNILVSQYPNIPPIVPATVEFLDIAGLVKGAAQGAGLGNKFLSHIREVSVIAHVVRAFTEEDIIREGSSDPESDYATIQTELILADLQSAQNHESRIKNKEEKALIIRIINDLNTGTPVRHMKFTEDEQEKVQQLFFLTAKPEIVVLNVSEDDEALVKQDVFRQRYANLLQVSQNRIVVICAKIESELAALSEEEQKQYLQELGLQESGLEKLIKKAYETLGLISFLTAGEKEVRAWTIRAGSTALAASGEIHTDFMKKFIKAEVISFDDYISLGGRKAAAEKGRTRLEGKDYIVQDGDVVEFKIGA